MSADALAEVERVLERGGDADDVLREVVSVLHDRLGRYVRISFVEAGGLTPGPAAGEEAATTTAFPITFQGRHVANLEAGGLEAGGDPAPADRAVLERVAALLAPYALVGWDTGGEEWTP